MDIGVLERVVALGGSGIAIAMKVVGPWRQWLWLLRPLPLLLLSSLSLPLPLPPVAATVVAAGVAVTAVADVAAQLLLAEACTSCVNSTPAKLSLFSSLSGGPAASMTS